MLSGMHGYVMTGRMSDFTSSVLDGMDSFFQMAHFTEHGTGTLAGFFNMLGCEGCVIYVEA